MWTLPDHDRLIKWKAFRAGLDMLPFEDAIKETIHLWSYAPFVNHYLDRVPVKEWPDPWTLLIDNKYCSQAKAYGMLATLYLSSHGSTHTISLVNGLSYDEPYNLVWIDQGKYVLNYRYDEVISNEQIENFTPSTVITVDDLGFTKHI